MFLNFDPEIAELRKLGLTIPEGTDALEVAMVLATAFDKGMSFERKRCLDIIARKALNATELRNEINRPVR